MISHKLLIFIVLIATFTVTGCAKKKACTDPKALNADINADKSDQEQCRFSTVTFYAGSNTYEGIEVEKITLRVGQDTIGVITSFNHSYPTSCSEAGTVQYSFGISGVEKVWFATYMLIDNEGEVNDQGRFEPDPNKECIRINVLP